MFFNFIERYLEKKVRYRSISGTFWGLCFQAFFLIPLSTFITKIEFSNPEFRLIFWIRVLL